jgi:hypothetical protein
MKADPYVSERVADYLVMAIQRRNAAREPGIHPILRRFRLASMRFWAKHAVQTAREHKIISRGGRLP